MSPVLLRSKIDDRPLASFDNKVHADYSSSRRPGDNRVGPDWKGNFQGINSSVREMLFSTVLKSLP